jgi:hypothetical protein
VVCLVLLTAAPVSAEASFELDWEADDGCPTESTAEVLLEGYLRSGSTQAQQHGDSGEPASVAVSIAKQEDGRFRAEVVVETEQGRGERAFAGTDCRDVAEAAALIAAMLIDPGQGGTGQDGASSAAAAADSNPEPQPLRLALGVHLLADTSSLPQPTAGGGLSVGVLWRRLHAGVRLSALLPRVSERGPASDSGGELGLYLAAIGCDFALLQAMGERLGTGPGRGFEAGLAVGEGRGVAVQRSERAPWAAPALGWALWLMTPPLGFSLRIEALAPLARPTWLLDDYGQLYRAPAAVGRVSLELAWLLP